MPASSDSTPPGAALLPAPHGLGRQLAIVAAIAVFGLLVFVLKLGIEQLLLATAGRSGAAAPPLPAGAFRVSAAQLADLKLQAVTRMAFRSVEHAEGKIAWNADRTTPVFSPLSGRVVRVLAGAGDTVKSGAPLALIEASEYVQAQNDLAAALTQAHLARTKQQRAQALFEAKGGALQDVQQAQADLDQAQTALNAVRNRLRILGRSDADIAALEAGSGPPSTVSAVSAPINGTISDRQVGPGQYVQAGASAPLFTLGDLSSVWLVANVREVDAPQLRKGQSVQMHVLALPQRVFDARLSFVAPMVDPATRTVAVRAEVANPDGLLKPEMFASFDIYTSDASEALAVPSDAVVYDGDSARVWVLGDGDTLAQRSIRVGRSMGESLEVLDGLHAGERIVTSGSLFIDRAARPE